MKKFKIYCAGFDVFHPNAKGIAEHQRKICENLSFEALTPMDNNFTVAEDIFYGNIEMIKECDYVVANINNFKGQDIDSGTAFEIGFAHAFNKPVFGYLSDNSSIVEKNNSKKFIIVGNQVYNLEDFDLPVNLMIAKSCTDIIVGNFAECLVNCVIPFTKKTDKVSEYHTVQLSWVNYYMKQSKKYQKLFPDLYEEILAHDKISKYSNYYKLSDKAYNQYENFIKFYSPYGNSNKDTGEKEDDF